MKALNPTSRVSSLSPDKAAASREVFGSPSGRRAAGTPAQLSPTHRGRSQAAGGTQQGGWERAFFVLAWAGAAGEVQLPRGCPGFVCCRRGRLLPCLCPRWKNKGRALARGSSTSPRCCGWLLRAACS